MQWFRRLMLSLSVLGLLSVGGSITSCSTAEKTNTAKSERSVAKQKKKKRRKFTRSREMRRGIKARREARKADGFKRKRGDAALIRRGNRERFGNSLDSW